MASLDRGQRTPVWGRDGRELFYLAGTRMMAAPVDTDLGFTFDASEEVFDGPYFVAAPGRTFDIGLDGRFLMLKPLPAEDTAGAPEITIVLNWHEELLERVPVP